MQRLNARQRQADSHLEVQINPTTTVLCRRRSLLSMFMSGVMPSRLIQAAEQLTDKYGHRNVADLGDVSDDEKHEMREMFEHFAAAVCEDPIVVLQPDGNSDHLPAAELEFYELLAIWTTINAQPIAVDAPVATPEIPDLRSEVARADFREADSSAASVAAPARENVPAATERVVDGRVVEYLGQ